MNIGIVTSWYPAGAGYVSKAYRKSLEEGGASVFIFARSGTNMKGSKEWDDPKVHWASQKNGVLKESELLFWVEKHQISVIFFNEQRYWKPLLALKQRRVIIGAYIDYYTQKTMPAFEIYDFLICNTKRHFSVFDWHHGSHFIQWGTDTQKFAPKESETEERPINFMVSAGWQIKNKADRRGSYLALEAFTKTKGNAKLLFYSQVGIEKASDDLRALIENDDRVEFITGTFDPFPFHKADVYLYPSRLDGIGLSLPEALSAGLAAITTDCPPMNEFVEDGKSGQYTEVEKFVARYDGYYWPESLCSMEDLTQKIQFYIDNPGVARRHGVQARESAVEKFNWTKNSSQLTEIFKKEEEKNSQMQIPARLIKLCNELDELYKPGINTHLKRAFNQFKKNALPFLYKN